MTSFPLVLCERIHRGQGLYAHSKSIDDMLKHLGEEISFLEDLQELGVEMDPEGNIHDDWYLLAKEVKEDSEEFKELIKKGFRKINFDKEGRKLA